jgi:hypothetical protein
MQLASRPRDDLDAAGCPRPGRSTTYHRRLGGSRLEGFDLWLPLFLELFYTLPLLFCSSLRFMH